MQTLGKKNGYQFLWKEAEANIHDTLAQFTFMQGGTYYSISSLINDSAKIFFTRTGANDPNFNLRREPSYIIRKNGEDQSFVSVIEIHGKYDPIGEFSMNSYPSVENISSIKNDDQYSIEEITIKGKKLIVLQCNADFSKTTKHTIDNNGIALSWTGPYSVLYDGKPL
jgi:hypothetical protein